MLPKLTLFALAAAFVVAEDENLMVYPQVKRAILEPRQSILPNLPASCTTDVLGLLAGLPTPPARLITAEGLSNPCSGTVPSSLSSDFNSYSSQLQSWFSSSSDDISSVLSECPQLRSLASSLPVCATGLLGGVLPSNSASATGTDTSSGASSTSSGASDSSGTAATASSTSTGSSSSSSSTGTETGSSASSTNSDGAAAHETGAAMAALAAAGLIAVVAL